MLALKIARQDRGLTQAALARMARLPQPIVCNIENGKWTPTSPELAALAMVLHVSPPELLLRDIQVPRDIRSAVAGPSASVAEVHP